MRERPENAMEMRDHCHLGNQDLLPGERIYGLNHSELRNRDSKKSRWMQIHLGSRTL